MAELEHVLLARPCHYDLPGDLKFLGLARPRGGEIIRIRFSRGRGTILDIPVSAGTLAALVQTLAPLHGNPPEDIQAELDDLQTKGLPILK